MEVFGDIVATTVVTIEHARKEVEVCEQAYVDKFAEAMTFLKSKGVTDTKDIVGSLLTQHNYVLAGGMKLLEIAYHHAHRIYTLAEKNMKLLEAGRVMEIKPVQLERIHDFWSLNVVSMCTESGKLITKLSTMTKK